MIVFTNVTKVFDGIVALKDITFSLVNCESLAIVGPSGSGKTTLARIIGGICKHTTGSVMIEDATQEHEIRKKVGFVFQSFNLFPHLTVAQNICYAPVEVYKKNPITTLLHCEELLQKFSLAASLEDAKVFAQKYPLQLSGGQKQRVAIIRSLILHPKIMVLDEPTSALDPELVSEVIGIINNLRSTGTSAIIVTHDLRVARATSTKLMFLCNGEIQDFGDTSTFFDVAHLEQKCQKYKTFYQNFFCTDVISTI